MKRTAIAICLAFLCAVPTDASVASLPDVAKAVDAFHGALQKGDRAAALASLDEKVQIYEQGWVEHSRAEYEANHLASDLKFAQATSTTQTARDIAVLREFGYVTTESRTTGTFEGKSVDSINLETMVLRLSEKGWRIVHIHWSSRKSS